MLGQGWEKADEEEKEEADEEEEEVGWGRGRKRGNWMKRREMGRMHGNDWRNRRKKGMMGGGRREEWRRKKTLQKNLCVMLCSRVRGTCSLFTMAPC